MLAPHGTSREMSGKVGIKKSDDPPDAQIDNRVKSDDQDQRRVKFDVVETARTCELVESKTS